MSHAKGAAMKVDSKTLATDLRKSHFTLGQTGLPSIPRIFADNLS